MKGKLAVVALFTTMGIASSVMAQDGTVNFTGKIIEAGCQVDSNVTNPQSVQLGEVAKTAFVAAGDTAATTKFSLVLTGCPADLLGKPVSVKYDGTPDAVNNDYLQLTNAGTAGIAEGVAIQLLNADSSALPLGVESKEVEIKGSAAAPESTKLDFYARYIATKAGVVGGDANGSVNFTLTYN